MHAIKAHFKSYWVQYLIAFLALGFDISMRIIAHSLDAQALHGSALNVLLGGKLQFFHGVSPLNFVVLVAGFAAWAVAIYITRNRWATLACFLFMLGLNNMWETSLFGFVTAISLPDSIIPSTVTNALGMVSMSILVVLELITFVKNKPSTIYIVRNDSRDRREHV